MRSSREHNYFLIHRGTELIHNRGYIVDGLGEDGWRWGYGMFAAGISENEPRSRLILSLPDFADHYACSYGARPDGPFLGGH